MKTILFVTALLLNSIFAFGQSDSVTSMVNFHGEQGLSIKVRVTLKVIPSADIDTVSFTYVIPSQEEGNNYSIEVEAMDEPVELTLSGYAPKYSVAKDFATHATYLHVNKNGMISLCKEKNQRAIYITIRYHKAGTRDYSLQSMIFEENRITKKVHVVKVNDTPAQVPMFTGTRQGPRPWQGATVPPKKL